MTNKEVKLHPQLKSYCRAAANIAEATKRLENTRLDWLRYIFAEKILANDGAPEWLPKTLLRTAISNDAMSRHVMESFRRDNDASYRALFWRNGHPCAAVPDEILLDIARNIHGLDVILAQSYQTERLGPLTGDYAQSHFGSFDLPGFFPSDLKRWW